MIVNQFFFIYVPLKPASYYQMGIDAVDTVPAPAIPRRRNLPPFVSWLLPPKSGSGHLKQAENAQLITWEHFKLNRTLKFYIRPSFHFPYLAINTEQKATRTQSVAHRPYFGFSYQKRQVKGLRKRRHCPRGWRDKTKSGSVNKFLHMSQVVLGRSTLFALVYFGGLSSYRCALLKTFCSASLTHMHNMFVRNHLTLWEMAWAACFAPGELTIYIESFLIQSFAFALTE